MLFLGFLLGGLGQGARAPELLDALNRAARRLVPVVIALVAMLGLSRIMVHAGMIDELAEEAWAGDVIGIPNYGNLHLGDALTEGEELHFRGLPAFAPELLQKVRPLDPLRAKHLGRALEQLAQEGAARTFKPMIGADWIVGVVGALQFDVMADRIRTEYDVPVVFEPTQYYTARWVEADEPQALKAFIDRNKANLAEDHEGFPVFMARNAWHLQDAQDGAKQVRFLATREPVTAA
jgi:peptide chain release factor 3